MVPNYSSAFLQSAKVLSAKLLRCLLTGTPNFQIRPIHRKSSIPSAQTL